ncbi:antitoxin PaaA2 family protein [Massilia pseudoviolaceinigra]|uniref:antitoxin PaaA2 family protein n=1 Tax=Massilia pseudoviolaceinigra TaxID=3057165 RepID=UPI0027964CB4|nr:hypothetical protein [Massilia sp. CCM 9206]MDQ1924722.1 hypothetical protein [Massilia sp. CCM 9206]
MDIIDHTTLAGLAGSGVVSSARVVGQADGWRILVMHGQSEQALSDPPGGRVRIFPKLDTLAAYLKDIGIVHFDVDAVNFGPAMIADTMRAALPSATKDSHSTAYVDWLKAEVQEAIDDTSPSVPHDEAMRQIRATVKLS